MCLCRMPCTLKNVEEVRSCNHVLSQEYKKEQHKKRYNSEAPQCISFQSYDIYGNFET